MPESSRLQIAERHVGDVTVLGLTGEMLLDDGDLGFRRKIHELVESGRVRIVVDLSGVTRIDSSGIGMLVAKVKTVREKRGRHQAGSPHPSHAESARDAQAGDGVRDAARRSGRRAQLLLEREGARRRMT